MALEQLIGHCRDLAAVVPPEATVYVPEKTAYWEKTWLEWSCAITEGLCPVHGTPLEPWPAPPRKIAGRCAPCHQYWGVNLDSQQAGWWLDHNPVTGWPAVAVPEFMAWQED